MYMMLTCEQSPMCVHIFNDYSISINSSKHNVSEHHRCISKTFAKDSHNFGISLNPTKPNECFIALNIDHNWDSILFHLTNVSKGWMVIGFDSSSTYIMHYPIYVWSELHKNLVPSFLCFHYSLYPSLLLFVTFIGSIYARHTSS